MTGIAALGGWIVLLAQAAIAISAALPAQVVSRARVTPASSVARRSPAALQSQRGEAAGRVPAIVTQAPLDTSQMVNFRVLVAPDTVYVGQQVTYQLGVFLERSVRDRLRRMEAIAPEMRGMMAYDPPAPLSGFPDRSVGALHYAAHVYERAVFPLAPGRLVIPEARLVYAMPLSYSFFSREESYELRSDSVVVIALEPPAAGRPADWDGAVGTLSVSARVDTTGARVGDAVRLTVSVAGRGNVKLFRRPRLEVPGASAVPTGERVTLSDDSLDVKGVKEFDWLLTPLRAGRLMLPPVRYPYFDPAIGEYAVTRSRAIALSIAPGALASTEGGEAARSPWPVRTVYRGALAPAPYDHRPFWWVMLLVPVPAVMVVLARRPRPRRGRISSPGRTLQLLSLEPAADPRAVRRAFLTALATRLQADASSLADPRDLERAARRSGTTSSTAASAAALLAELDAAAFSPHTLAAGDLATRADRVYRDIDAGARRFRVPQRRTTVALLVGASLALSAVAHAVVPDRDALQYARGVDAYRRGGFALAARDFAALATRVPRAADAWANLGTASFAAGDTARAIAGWERALRLEPRASDVRERLESIGSTTTIGPGAVPAIAPEPLAVLGAIFWVAGWLALAWLLLRRRPATTLALAATALAVAAALGGSVAVLDARLAGRNLVVGARDAPLRILPALASDQQATLRAGEIARVTERDGPWAYVAAAGGREGWTDSESLYRIARD